MGVRSLGRGADRALFGHGLVVELQLSGLEQIIVELGEIIVIGRQRRGFMQVRGGG